MTRLQSNPTDPPAPEPARDPAGKRRAALAILLLAPVPSLAVLAYIHLQDRRGELIFAACKAWIFLLPVAWHTLVDRKRIRLPKPSATGMTAACVTGGLIFVAIVAGHFLVGRHWLDAEIFRERLTAVGFDKPSAYLAAAVYWCTINSLGEEYVWRWFVFTRCEALMTRAWAVLVSGLLFTLHHIIVVDFYTDWNVTLPASIGVWIGGTTWSWLYLRYRNIWAAYVSHVFADVAIFLIGYLILFR